MFRTLKRLGNGIRDSNLSMCVGLAQLLLSMYSQYFEDNTQISPPLN